MHINLTMQLQQVFEKNISKTYFLQTESLIYNYYILLIQSTSFVLKNPICNNNKKKNLVNVVCLLHLVNEQN